MITEKAFYIVTIATIKLYDTGMHVGQNWQTLLQLGIRIQLYFFGKQSNINAEIEYKAMALWSYMVLTQLTNGLTGSYN